MKPYTSGFIFTQFSVVIIQAPVLQADREREAERTWAGITTSRGGRQVQKALAYSKNIDWILKKRQYTVM